MPDWCLADTQQHWLRKQTRRLHAMFAISASEKLLILGLGLARFEKSVNDKARPKGQGTATRGDSQRVSSQAEEWRPAQANLRPS